ncbi:hypothetical protein GCM10009793_06890 [Brachybacterium phenoliresistens]
MERERSGAPSVCARDGAKSGEGACSSEGPSLRGVVPCSDMLSSVLLIRPVAGIASILRSRAAARGDGARPRTQYR